MSGFGRIDLKQFRQFQKNLEALSKADVDKICRDMARQLAARLLRKVKMRTPVDTGELRRNWTCDNEVIRSGWDYTIEIINSTPYAVYVEFGHRTRGGDGWITGCLMLTRSEIELRAQAPKILEKYLLQKLGEVFNGK